MADDARSDDAVREAALHLIAAGRSLLDAAEAAIDDPAMRDRVVGLVALLGDRLAGSGADRSQPTDGSNDDPGSNVTEGTDEGP